MAAEVETATTIVVSPATEEDPVPIRETMMVAHASSKKVYASIATRKDTSGSTVLAVVVEEAAVVLPETEEIGVTIATEAIASEIVETTAVETITDPVRIIIQEKEKENTVV